MAVINKGSGYKFNAAIIVYPRRVTKFKVGLYTGVIIIA